MKDQINNNNETTSKENSFNEDDEIEKLEKSIEDSKQYFFIKKNLLTKHDFIKPDEFELSKKKVFTNTNAINLFKGFIRSKMSK